MHVADHSGRWPTRPCSRSARCKSGARVDPRDRLRAEPARRSEPTIAEGRAPTAPDEVALGATTMARLHTQVGATIELAEHEQGPNHPVRVVGRSVLPGLAPYPGSDKAGLGVGALLSQAGWKQFSTDFQKTEYVFRWAPRSLGRDAHADLRPADAVTAAPHRRPDQPPGRGRQRATAALDPTLLASLVAALLLAAAVANALVVTVRRRRRELAVLCARSASPGPDPQDRALAGDHRCRVAAALGIPAGSHHRPLDLDLARHHLGTLACRSCRPSTCSRVAAAVVVLANLVAFVPGLRAGRGPVRRYERSERTAMSR